MAYSHDINLTSPGTPHNINFGESLSFNISPKIPVQALISDNIELIQHHILSINNTNQIQNSDNTITVYHPVTYSILTNAAITIEIEKESNVELYNAAIQVEITPLEEVFVTNTAEMVEYQNPDIIQVTNVAQMVEYNFNVILSGIQNSVQVQTSEDVVLIQNQLLVVQSSSHIQNTIYPITFVDGYGGDTNTAYDTMLYEADYGHNYGATGYMDVGDANVYHAKRRILIKFNLSSIPDNAIINSAILELTPIQDNSDNTRIFRVYRQKRAWIEGDKNAAPDSPASGATWQRYDTTNSWQTDGGFGANDCEQTDIGYREFSSSETLNSPVYISLTPITKGDLDLGNGWMIKADTEFSDMYRFASSDHATTSYRPKLTIIYTIDILLTQHQTIVVENSTQEQTSDNIILAQNYNLVIQNIIHSQTSENIALIQQQVISIQDSAQSQTSDNIELTYHGETIQALPQDTIHLQSSENTELTQNYILEMDDSIHLHFSDKVQFPHEIYITNASIEIEYKPDKKIQLTNASIEIEYKPNKKVILTNLALMVEYNTHVSLPEVQNSTHTHTASNVDLIQNYILEIAPVILTLEDGGYIIDENGNYLLWDGLSGDSHIQTSDNIELTYHEETIQALSQDTIHLQSSDNIILVANYGSSRQTNAGIMVEYDYNIAALQTNAAIMVEYDYNIAALQTNAAIMVEYTTVYYLVIQNSTHSQTTEWKTELNIQDSIQEQTSDNIALTQNQILSVQDTIHSQTSDNIALIQHQILSVQDTTHSQTSDNIALIQHQILSLQDTIHSQTSDNIALIQHQILSVQDTTHSQSSDNITLTQNQVLTIQDTIHIQTSDNTELLQHEIGSIAVLNSKQLQISDNIILTQNYLLTIHDTNQLQSCDNITLIQNYILTINDTTHNEVSLSISLIYHQLLIINDANQSQNADNIILVAYIPTWSLTIQDSLHLQSSDNVDLIHNNLLTIQNVIHVITSDNIILNQNYVLIIQSAIQLQSPDNILLSQNYILVTNNTSHIHTVENIILIQNYILNILDSTCIHNVENIVLTQGYILLIHDTVHFHIADIAFYAGITNSSIHLQTADNIILTAYIPNWILTIQNSIQYQASENIELTQHYILVLQNSVHLQITDNVYYGGITQNTVQLQTSDTIILTAYGPIFSLVVADTTQLQTANDITLFLPTGNILSNVGSFILASGDRVIYTGFRPKIVLFWWSGGLGSGDTTSGSNIAYGFGAGTSASTVYLTEASADEVTTSSTYRGWAINDGVIRITNPTGTAYSQLTIKSMNSDGFTLTTWTYTKNYRISYLALGGNGLTSAKIGYAQMPASVGEYDVTGIGFQPDALLTLHGFTLNDYVYQAGEYFNMGMATSASCQGTISIAGLNAQAISSTARYCYNGEVNSTVYPPNLINYRDSFVSFLPDGFRMNHLEGSGLKYTYIVLKGGRYIVGDMFTSTNSDNIIETTGFQPSAILFTSVNQELIGSDVGAGQGKWSLGAGNQSNQVVHAISDKNSVDITETAHGNYNNGVYAFIENNTIVGKMEIKSIDFTGFTAAMSIPDSFPSWVTYLAIGGVGETNRAIQTQTSENITLTAYDYNLLTIQDGIHPQTADNTILVTDIVILRMQDCTQIQTSENVGLVSSLPVLTLQNPIHFQLSDNVALFAHYSLTVQSTTQGQIAQNILLIWSSGEKVYSRVGSFNIDPTKTVGQTQVITNLGFRPKLVIFWCSGSSGSGNYAAQGTFNVVFGAATSGSTRFCIGSISEDNQATSDNYHWTYNTQIIRIYNNTGSVNGILDFTSMDEDGFTTHIDDQFTVPFKIDYLALGGLNFHTYIGYSTFRTIAGIDTYSIGFQPDALIFSSGFTSSAATGAANTYFDLGIASGSVPGKQGTTSIAALDNLGTTSANSYGYNNEVMALAGTTSGSYRVNLVSFNPTGFSINMTDPGSALYFYYIALKGASFVVGNINTRTDVNDIIETTGFKPSSLLMFSNNRPLSTIDQPTVHGAISIGAADYMGNQVVASVWEKNGVTPSKNAFGDYSSAIYLNITDAATLGAMSINSLNDNGFTANMTIPDSSENWITYLAIGIPPTIILVENSTHLQTAETPTPLYYLNPARADNTIHAQTSDNIELSQSYTLTISDATQVQIAENTHITTDIIILKMNDSIQQQVSQEISFRSVSIFGYRKISFGIGKKGTGGL